MTSTLGRLVLALSLGACSSVQTARSHAPSSKPGIIAFVHANVVPMDEERVLRDQTVVVSDGTIVDLGPASAVKAPAGAVLVDARGRYLIPALCDMHVHLLSEAWNVLLPPDAKQTSLPLESFIFPYVANGVTTVQVMAATTEDIALRRRIDAGDLIGPRLILARMIDGPKKAWPPPLATWVETAAEARDAVRRAKEEGYDKIKVYSFLNKDSYDATVATAKELGMDVIGHIPDALSVEYVLDAGQKLVAHSEEVWKHAGGDYSRERIDAFAELLAKRGVWMTPTLATTRSILEVFSVPDGLVNRPEAAYFKHPMQAGVWSFLMEKRYKPIPAETREELRRAFETFQKPLTKAFRDKGGKVMTGTDTSWPGLVPGFALHRELRELVDVRLTPYEALRASTTTPFEYLGESDKAGTIAVGRRSDLLLLDENPLEDISAASKIAGVLVRGRWLDREEIHNRMQAIAAPSGQH